MSHRERSASRGRSRSLPVRSFLCLASFLCGPATAAAELFGPAAASFPAGDGASSVVVRDLDGDGVLDLAVANEFADSVSVLLGDGLGSFATLAETPVGRDPSSIVAGDFDGDGVADLAVAALSDNAINVLSGLGQGRFVRGPDLAVGSAPTSVVAADFDRDGALDLGCTNFFSATVSILAGDGRGGFGVPVDYAVGAGPRWVTVADFDGDRAADLAVVNSGAGSVSILLGDGLGGFAPAAVEPGVGSNPRAAAVADFDRDGARDLAVVNRSSGSLSILRGDGAGGFAPASSIAVGFVPISVATGDFDSDGAADLAVVNSGAESVSVLRGDGTGSFTRTDLGVGGPLAAGIGDFNSDGAADLAVTGAGRKVSILLSDGIGGFSGAARVQVDGAPRSIRVAEFNGDGFPDVAVVETALETLTLLLSDERGGLSRGPDLDVGDPPLAVAVADFDRDGLDDLAINYLKGDDFVDSVIVELRLPAGGFARSADVEVGEGRSPGFYAGDSKLAVADFDRDGFLDVAVATTDSVGILRGDGHGGLSLVADHELGLTTTAVVAADFDRDGAADLAASSFVGATGTVSVFHNDGAGGLEVLQEIAVARQPISLAVGHFDDGAVPDLAVASEADLVIGILLGTGTGEFTSAPDVALGTHPRSIAVVDHNDDGRDDLAVANSEGAVHLLIGDGAGGFYGTADLELGSALSSVAAGDLDHDGAPDLAVADLLADLVTSVFGRLDERSDVDGSNRTDGFDIARIGRTLGARAGDAGYKRNADVDLDGIVDGEDLALAAGRFTALNRSLSPLRATLEAPLPADPDTVTLQPLLSEGDLLTVQIVVHDTDDAVTTGDFAVTFEPEGGAIGQVLEVAGFESGSYLAGRVGQLFSLDTATPGRVGVTAARLPQLDRAGSGVQPLMNLVFRARREGTATLDFAGFQGAAPALLDTTGQPAPGVTFRGGVEVRVSAAGAGPPSQKIGFFPAAIDFGQVDPGGTARRRLRISNFGFSDLEVRDVGVSLPEFSSFFGAAFTVPPFGFVELGVEFDPERSGFFSGDLVIASDDQRQPAIFVPLAGNSDPTLGVAPGRLDFGLVPVGAVRTLLLSLANLGAEPLALSALQSSDALYVATAGFTEIAPGATGEIEVSFQPPGVQEVRAALTLNLTASEQRLVSIGLAGRGDPDADADGVADRLDNCPDTPNPSQDDADDDGIGDACDPDS